MALMNVDDVVNGVAALMDDPGGTEIDNDYVLPFLNLKWANLTVNMAMLGLQYSEEEAIINVPPNTRSLRVFMVPGQPLASLMLVKSIDWKQPGQQDIQYQPAQSVNELDDVPQGTIGVAEYQWRAGNCFLNPSGVAVVLRVRFLAMSTNLVDPDDMMVRGVADILAFRVAALIYAIRGNKDLVAEMKEQGDTHLDDFIALGVMRNQSQFYQIPPTHRRGLPYGNGFNFTMPPGR